MPRFFDPRARVIINSETQPQNTVQIRHQPWEADESDIPLDPPPLRRGIGLDHLRKLQAEGDGIVHVSLFTGERHIHGEVEQVDHEPGMVRVIGEDVRPLRPIGQEEYHNFAGELRSTSFTFFQRILTQAVFDGSGLDKDCRSVVCSYLFAN
jgi:hypothetical protein